MSDDEEFMFLQEMADVKPIRQEQRVALKRDGPSADTARERRSAAVAAAADPNPLSDEGISPLDPWFVLDFKRAGVQNGVFRKLKQGRYEAEARLNMHRMSVKRARQELFEFIEQSAALGLRSVMLIHGKGENSVGGKEQASIIKGCVEHWLRELELVLAFHSARPQHGGTGACYVLLRKSEEAKQKNRERFR
ncbi:MAG: DNA endonuclease SmrA [Halieaceae bacterium]